jgi:hypothetical protein
VIAALIASRSERLSTGLLEARAWHSLGAVLAVNLALVLFTNQYTLRNFPNSGDEYAYLVSATLFSEGKLSVASPEPAAPFSLNHVLNDGRFYGKYPPGWPALLSLGVLFGLPWLVNPCLGALTLYLIHRIGRENFSLRGANAAVYVTLGNPFFVFNTASYFSHASCLCFLALAVLFLFRGVQASSPAADQIGLGLAAGMAFSIRPYTAVAFLLPLALWYATSKDRSETWPSWTRKQALALGGFLLPFLFFLGYNKLQTGSPWVQPFNRYDPKEMETLSVLGHDWRPAWRLLLERIGELMIWVPLSLAFIPLYFLGKETRWNPKGPLLAVASLTLLVAYFFYSFHGGIRYGPRYIYEASLGLIVISGAALSQLRSWPLHVLAAVLLMNGGLFWSATRHHHRQVRETMAVYDRVREKGITRGVVFLKTGGGIMGPEDLARNGIHFSDQPVLYVRDLGDASNLSVLENFPGRPAYTYAYDSARHEAVLSPYQAAPASP